MARLSWQQMRYPYSRSLDGGGAAAKRAYIAISYGQSLSLRRASRVTTAAVAGTYTAPGGSEITDFATWQNDTHTQRWSEFDGSWVAFTENSAGEGWGPALGDALMSISGVERVHFFCPGDGSRNWRSLKDGTGQYGTMIMSIEAAFRDLISLGYTAQEIGLVFIWTQGESDCVQGANTSSITQAQYLNVIMKLRDIVLPDVRTIWYDETFTPEIFISPMQQSSTTFDDGWKEVQAAQLEAGQTLSGVTLLPAYGEEIDQYEGDGVHVKGQGRRNYGDKAGKAIKQVLSGGSFLPLHMDGAVQDGDEIGVTFTKDIEIDTTDVDEIDDATFPNSKYGFQVTDDGVLVDITGVTVSGAAATLTLASTPSGAVVVQMSQHKQSAATAANSKKDRSNIRSATSIDGAYDYAVPQSIEAT